MSIDSVSNTGSNKIKEENKIVVDIIKQKKEDLIKITNKNANCEFGIPVLECEPLTKARGAFGIPVTENVYLINDGAILSPWTKGFAICGTGIYSRVKQQKYISWNDIKKMRIKNEIYLYIGENEYSVTGSDLQKMIYELLCDIQSSI